MYGERVSFSLAFSRDYLIGVVFPRSPVACRIRISVCIRAVPSFAGIGFFLRFRALLRTNTKKNVIDWKRGLVGVHVV